MLTVEFIAAVERFASAFALLDERALETAFPEPSRADPQLPSYADYPRDMFFAAYQRLCGLAVSSAERRAELQPLSRAQRILGLHHSAYRDLTGALVGIPDDALDREPVAGEWSIRATLSHMLMAESGFRMAIEWALLQRDRPNLTIDQFDTQAVLRQCRERYPFDGDLASFHASFATVHGLALDAFSPLPDADLERPMIWWDSVMPIRALLHGFNSHMREHTVQLDKTIAAIGVPLTEGARLARLLHCVLGDCEATQLGAPAVSSPLQQEVERHFALWNAVLPG
jgi:hypothetical protein